MAPDRVTQKLQCCHRLCSWREWRRRGGGAGGGAAAGWVGGWKGGWVAQHGGGRAGVDAHQPVTANRRTTKAPPNPSRL